MISEIGVKCFLAAAENGSFTKTAEELYMTRQAVSKQIAQLEKELGVKLFERTTAKVEITPAGSMFVTYFTNTLKEWEKVRFLAKAMEEKQKNTVRIGSPYDMDIGNKIYQAEQKCREEGLELQLEWERSEAEKLVRMLMEGRIDVAISFERAMEEVEGAKDALDLQFFSRNSAFLTVSKRNRHYSEQATVTDFEEEPLYVAKDMFPAGIGLDVFRKDWEKYGLYLKDIRVSPNRDSMKTMVELGVGFTICTNLDSFSKTKGIVTIPLNRTMELYTIWRKDENNTPVLAFLDELNRLNI